MDVCWVVVVVMKAFVLSKLPIFHHIFLIHSFTLV